MESVHGHDVMHYMLEKGGAFNKETPFHTCSASEMTAAELVDFLESRGKFLGSEEAFQTDESKICNH